MRLDGLPKSPPKSRPGEILTVPNAQSHLQYIDAMHNPPPAHPATTTDEQPASF